MVSRCVPWANRVIVLAVVALLVLVAAGCGGADEPTNQPSAETRETVDAWQEAVLAQDARAIAALYSDDAIWRDEALDDTFTGTSGARRGWDIFGGVASVELDELAVTTDTAVFRWSLVGTGDRWSLIGVSVLELDGASIVAETVFYDCAQSPLAQSCANVR